MIRFSQKDSLKCVNLVILLLIERARATLRDMGPAVWNGGLSTFLAVVLLAFSNSYVFKSFFKVSVPKKKKQ